MNLAPILDLVRRLVGIDPDALGSGAVRVAVLARLRERGIADPLRYAALLERDADEFARLIDRVVVPETWFFRGGDLFAHVAAHVRDLAGVRGAAAPVRILSLPCSTGEEPYSLAIALDDLGVSPDRWLLEAVDISPAHISRARAGVYGALSFRQTSEEIRRRHFTPTDGGWRINPTLAARVQFQVGNLLDPGLLLASAPFDVVFCRNLFIYLDRPSRQRALAVLAGLIREGGLLVVGHADALPLDDPRFQPTGPGEYFIHKRAALNDRLLPPPAPIRLALPPPRPVRSAVAAVVAPPVQALAPAPPLTEVLVEARRLADAGRYDEALGLCRDALPRFTSAADLHTLLGTLEQARGHTPAATAAFTRALYLQPDHRDALTHLALLYEALGDAPRALALRRRLARLPTPGDE